MRSAYMVLGVPGDATAEEIEAAFQRAERLFTRERLAQEDGALARLGELKSAFQVLRDPAARAAHDRKLHEGARPTRTVIVERESSGGRVLSSALWLVGLAIAIAAFTAWRHAETRKEQELAARQAAEQAAAQQRDEEQRQAAQRAGAAAQAEANEARLRQEAQQSSARAGAEMRAQEANAVSARRQELADQQRRDAQQRSDDSRAANEARMRTERDKQRVREICIQVYRRPDC